MSDPKQIRGYVLGNKVGEGGFGEVFRASQTVIERDVAIKIIKETYSNQPDFIRRFETEARVIARLEHPHIVPLYDYWRDPDGAYLVMRWLRGGSLRDKIKNRSLTLGQVVRFISEICHALALAHEQNIVHRDIKPENILLDDRNYAYLTDFGIAIDLLQSDTTISEEVLRYASVDYVAPEQLTKKEVVPQSDIYSMGIMLFELLTTKKPFKSDTKGDILNKQVFTPLPSLLISRPDLPPALNEVIWRATNKQPAARYQSAIDFANALQNAAKEADATSRPFTAQPGSSPPTSNTQPVLQNRTRRLETGDLNTNQLFDDENDDTQQFGTQQLGPQPSGIESVSGAGIFGDYRETGRLTLDMPSHNPYKGLQAFNEADANDFFGRSTAISDLLDKLETQQFLALVGASGSGKSSLMRAGVIPELRAGALTTSRDWYITDMIPGSNPYTALADALSRVAVSMPADFAARIRENPAALSDMLPDILPDDSAELFLFIDQFEELFTICDDEATRQQFLALLHDAITTDDTRIRISLTLRADFYDRPLNYSDFGNLMRQYTTVVLPLTVNEIEEAIVQPARRVGVRVEDKLVNALVSDVYNQPGALPLLQYALTQIYERRAGGILTYDLYDELGGITGTLAETANDLYSSMDASTQRVTRQIFLQLITLENRATPTRRRETWSTIVKRNDSPQLADAVVSRFARQRLLTLDRDPATRQPMIEIAHEALIDAWDKLSAWIDQNRADLQRYIQLKDETDIWLDAGKDESYLARGTRLAEFETLLDNRTLPLQPTETEYLEKSIVLRQRDQRRTQIIIGTLSILLIAALGLTAFAYFQQQSAVQAQQEALAERDRANQAARTARSRELAASALSNLERNDLALLLSIEAVTTAQTYEARSSLLQSLQANPFLETYLHGHENAIRSLALNADGSFAVSGGRAGRIIRWDLTTGTMIGTPVAAHDGTVNAVAIHPNGRQFATAGADNRVRLWDTNGDALTTIDIADDAVWSVAYHPDGTQLAIGTADGTIWLWNIPDNNIQAELADAHDDIVYAVAYHPTQNILASGGGDNRVRLWDTTDATPIGNPLEGHTNWVLTLAFHPDGNRLASAGADAIIRLWTLDTQIPAGELRTGYRAFVRDIDFSSNGQFLTAVSNEDERIIVWDLQRNQPAVNPLVAHTAGIWGVEFFPDSLRLLSAGTDRNILQWHIQFPQRPADDIARTNQQISAFAANDRAFLTAGNASASGETTLRLWNAETLAALDTLDSIEEETSIIVAAALSPDGSRMVTAPGDSVQPTLRDARTGALIRQLDGHNSLVTDIHFLPDSQTFISGDERGSLLRWDAATGDLLDDSLAIDGNITRIAISPDAMYLAVGRNDGTILMYHLQDERWFDAPLDFHTAAVSALVFSPDSQRVISGARDDQIILWNATTGERIQQPLAGHDDWVLGLSVNPSQTVIASASRDGTIRLWDYAAGRPIGSPLIGHNDWVQAVTFLSDSRLLSASRDTTIVEWNTSIDNWIQQACEIANRNLAPDEQQQFFPDGDSSVTCPAGSE